MPATTAERDESPHNGSRGDRNVHRKEVDFIIKRLKNGIYYLILRTQMYSSLP